jgi:tryptophan synthase beta chain
LRQKPIRGDMMRLFGAVVHESPSNLTEVGLRSLKEDPDGIGTLAGATGEALALAGEDSESRFAVGSGENSVLLHQTIIGQEAISQMASLGDFPDCVLACMGAGSNFGGITLPFLGAAKDSGRSIRLIACESAACPKLTRGRYRYDLSDALGTTPITKIYSLGSTYVPPPVYAGGLRHHSAGPLASAMYADGSAEAMAIDQLTSFRAGMLFCETEGILPAPEHQRARPVGPGRLQPFRRRRYRTGDSGRRQPVEEPERPGGVQPAHRGTCGSDVTAEDAINSEPGGYLLAR